MTTTAPAALLPLVSMKRRPSCASIWPSAERAAMASKLRALGTTITELSDARELLGMARLSEASPQARAVAHHLLAGVRGHRAIATARERRVLLVSGLESCDRAAIATARHLLGLRTASPSSWRLGELSAVYAQARLVEMSFEG